MLEIIRASILNAYDSMPFEQFLDLHVMAVQDNNIISEIKYNITRNTSSILDIERLAQSEHERLVDST